MEIDGITIKVVGDDISEDEVNAYVKRGLAAYGNMKKMKVKLDGDNVELTYGTAVVPQERITRIR